MKEGTMEVLIIHLTQGHTTGGGNALNKRTSFYPISKLWDHFTRSTPCKTDSVLEK